MKHLTLFFAFGALLFLSCQTVSARGVKIPFGDREVLNKVASLYRAGAPPRRILRKRRHLL